MEPSNPNLDVESRCPKINLSSEQRKYSNFKKGYDCKLLTVRTKVLFHFDKFILLITSRQFQGHPVEEVAKNMNGLILVVTYIYLQFYI